MDDIRFRNSLKIKKGLNIKDLSDSLFFPKFFEVETVNACNARCRMCTIKSWKKRDSYLMPQETWGKFISEIKNYAHWIERVNVSRDGEPLLDKRLESKIRQLKKCGIRYVTFATNCSLLDKKRSGSLLDSGLDDIMFSIDGFSKRVFEKIRSGLKFEQVVENSKNFIKIRDKGNHKTTIRIRMVLQDSNAAELGDWLRYWKKFLRNGDRVYAKPAHSWGNQLSGYGRIVKGLSGKKYTEEPCISVWSTAIIKVNGDIPLCPVDFKCRFLMGNINDLSIREIWGSPGFDTARDKLISGKRNDLKLCKDCYLWDRQTIIEQ